MAEEWLIDGYNLLYERARSPRSGTNPSRSAADSRRKSASERSDLLARLASFAAAGDRAVTVVLDGKGNAAELETYRTARFEVVYSQKVSADSCIERRLFERPNRIGVTVVTADRAITDVARGMGGRVMKPLEFLRLLKDEDKAGEERLFRDRVRGHGFNRPFGDKL